MPAEIHVFRFETKTWGEFCIMIVLYISNIPLGQLKVDGKTDVTWNKSAFKQLVAADDTKELIRAMVSAHGARVDTSPDIIDGKSQGLIILLHGGSGTGKTLTAECIAEEQERPLYRATCGDVGLEPQQVEVVRRCFAQAL
jgi:ATP-dependent Lon protease